MFYPFSFPSLPLSPPPHFILKVLTIGGNGAHVQGILSSPTNNGAPHKTLEVSGSQNSGLFVRDMIASLKIDDGATLKHTEDAHGEEHGKQTEGPSRSRRTHGPDGAYTPFFGQSTNTCFEGDTTKRSVTIGIFLGTALHSGAGGSTAYGISCNAQGMCACSANTGCATQANTPVFAGSDANAVTHLTAWFVAANLIYNGNLNIDLIMGDIVKGTGAELWDTCTPTVNSAVLAKGADGAAGGQLNLFQDVSTATHSGMVQPRACLSRSLITILPASEEPTNAPLLCTCFVRFRVVLCVAFLSVVAGC